MPANYVLLEKITVGAAGASSVTFSGIPQTGYTDLVIKYSIRFTDSGTSNSALFRLNGSTTNYTRKVIEGAGSGTPGSFGGASSAWSTTDLNAAGSTANTFSNCELYIPNYTSSNYKSASMDATMENNATTSYMTLNAFLWSDNAAITTISCTGNLAQYSTFYLYGVAKLGTTPVIVPYATGGDTIMTDGTYWYHAFKASGTFTPATGKTLSCDVLAIAGGGSGSLDGAQYWGGGGGGAGGVFYATSQSFSTAQTVTVGGGGAINVTGYSLGDNGSNSTFGSLTAAVGGGSGWNRPGGSGGGTVNRIIGSTGGASTQTGTGGTGYGFAGGGSGFQSQAGGGGAGAVGGSATGNNLPGAGGVGLNTWSTWLSTTGTGVSGYIAGGGGGSANANYGSGPGGAGGSGGGGAGSNGTNGANGTAGTANTGGGGGGAGGYTSTASGNPGAGGSGIVIVRYAV